MTQVMVNESLYLFYMYDVARNNLRGRDLYHMTISEYCRLQSQSFLEFLDD